MTQGTKNTVQGWTLYKALSWELLRSQSSLHPLTPLFPPFGEAIVIRIKQFTQCGELGLTSFLLDPEHLISEPEPRAQLLAPMGTSQP